MPLLFSIIVIVLFPIVLWQKSREQKRKRVERETAHQEYMRKIRMEEEARLAEQENQKRKQAERENAYQAMVAAINPVPIIPTEEKAKKTAISFLNNLKYSTITVRSNLEQLSNYVSIDAETTGLKCVSDEIIEVAAIRFQNFEPVEKFVTLLSPAKPIPEQATEINHITNDMVLGKPCFQQIAASLVEFIGNDNIVGHNLPFDLKFIVHYGANITNIPRKYYDTLDLSRKTIRNLDNYKLLTVCVSVGIPGVSYKTLHRAEADALATGLLFQRLIDIRVTKKK